MSTNSVTLSEGEYVALVEKQQRADRYLAVLRNEFIATKVELVPDQSWSECKRCHSFWSGIENSQEWHENSCIFWDGIQQL